MDQSAFRSLLASASSTVPRASSFGGAARASTGDAGSSRRPRGGGFPFRGRGGAVRGGSLSAASGPSYRDRAAERRKVGGADDEPLSALDYEQSKFLGGDLEHTHLVKGVDFALLAKMRRATEAADETALDDAMEAAAGAGAGSDAGMDFEALDALLNSTSVWAAGIVTAALAGTRAAGPARASAMCFNNGRITFSFDVNHVFDGVQDSTPPLIILRGEDDAPDDGDLVADTLPVALYQEVERVFQDKKGRGARKMQTRPILAAATVNEDAAPSAAVLPAAAVIPTAPSFKSEAAPIVPSAVEDDDGDIFAGIGDYAAVAAARVSDAVAIAAASAGVTTATSSTDANAVRAAVLAARGRADVIAANSAAAPSFEGDAVASAEPVPAPRAHAAAQPTRRVVPHHLALDIDEIGDADALAEWDALEGSETLAEKKRRLAREVEDAALAASKDAAASRFTARFSSNVDARAAYARRSGAIDPLARGGISGGIQDDASGSYGERYDRDAVRRDDYTRELVDEDEDADSSRNAVQCGVGAAAGSALKPGMGQGAVPTITASGRDAFAFAGLQQPAKPRDSGQKRARTAVKHTDDADVSALRSGNLHMLGGDSGVAASKAGGGAAGVASVSDVAWRASLAGDDDERGGKRITKKQKFSQEHAAVMKLVEEKKG